MIDDYEVRKAVLANALSHGGKAAAGSVISALIGGNKGLLGEAKELKLSVDRIVSEINSKPADELERMADEYNVTAAKKEKKEIGGLRPLPGTENGVVVRFPPEPSGFMHLGHAIAALINYMYKEKYEGKMWLRFEDTNPNRVRQEFVDSFKNGLSWLGIKWDYEKFVTEDMQRIYEYGEKMIESGKAYVCTCGKDETKKNRFEGTECKCRARSTEENRELWDRAKTGAIGPEEAVVRMKFDMKSKDASLRDPTVFRIIKTEYKNYSLWPLYDFASAIEDDMCGVTHIIRSNEFRNSLLKELRTAMGLREPVLVEFSRYNFEGTPFSKRTIRAMIEKGDIGGWDDIRLPTISAIIRRGIKPQAFREFILRSGYSESKHEYTWDTLFTLNRRLIDPVSRRLFFVPEPVRLVVDNAPTKRVVIKNHPSEDLGGRKVDTGNVFFIPRKDLDNTAANNVLRLKDLFDVRMDFIGNGEAHASFYGDEMKGGEKIVQWVTDDNVKTKVEVVGNLLNKDETFNKDSLTVVEGLAESAVRSVEEGETVQFERFGFCILDDKKEEKFVFVSK